MKQKTGNKRKRRRPIALLLALVMVFTIIPSAAFAQEGETGEPITVTFEDVDAEIGMTLSKKTCTFADGTSMDITPGVPAETEGKEIERLLLGFSTSNEEYVLAGFEVNGQQFVTNGDFTEENCEFLEKGTITVRVDNYRIRFVNTVFNQSVVIKPIFKKIGHGTVTVKTEAPEAENSPTIYYKDGSDMWASYSEYTGRPVTHESWASMSFFAYGGSDEVFILEKITVEGTNSGTHTFMVDDITGTPQYFQIDSIDPTAQWASVSSGKMMLNWNYVNGYSVVIGNDETPSLNEDLVVTFHFADLKKLEDTKILAKKELEVYKNNPLLTGEQQEKVDQLIEAAEALIEDSKSEERLKTVTEFAKNSLDDAIKSMPPQALKLGVTGFKAEAASDGTIRLSWNPSEDASGYRIYRSESENGIYTFMKQTQDTSIANIKVTAGKTYYYKVRAYAASGEESYYGDWSESVKAVAMEVKTPAEPEQKPSVDDTIQKVKVAKVTSVKAKATAKKKIKITWKKTDGASGYVVYRATKKTGKYKAIKNVKSVKYTDKKVKSKKTYYYKVRAYKTVNGEKVYGAYSKAVKRKAK